MIKRMLCLAIVLYCLAPVWTFGQSKASLGQSLGPLVTSLNSGEKNIGQMQLSMTFGQRETFFATFIGGQSAVLAEVVSHVGELDSIYSRMKSAEDKKLVRDILDVRVTLAMELIDANLSFLNETLPKLSNAALSTEIRQVRDVMQKIQITLRSR